MNVAVTCPLSEIVAAGFYYSEKPELYYWRNINHTGAPEVATEPLTNFRVSPYLGFTRAQGLSLTKVVRPDRLRLMMSPATAAEWSNVDTNNYGVFSRYDYPYAPNDTETLAVGIFGGSVSQWFALQGARPLIATLQASPGLRSRSILVLNFANGGYKQPQQLLFLNYLLAIGQRLDYVVNIDGFNEVAIAAVNVAGGISVAMPSVQHMAPLTNLTRLRMEPSDLARLTELSDTSRQLTELQAVTERHPLALMWVNRVAGSNR